MYFQIEHKKVENDRRVKALDLTNIMETTNAAFLEVKKLHADVDDWSASNFANNKTAGGVVIADYQEAFQILLQYKETLAIAVSEHTIEKRNATRRTRDRKRGCKDILTDSGVADAFAEHIALHMETRRNGHWSDAFYPRCDGSSEGYRCELGEDHDFSKPAGLNVSVDVAASDAPGHWHAACNAAFEALKEAADEKTNKASVVMKKLADVKKKDDPHSLIFQTCRSTLVDFSNLRSSIC